MMLGLRQRQLRWCQDLKYAESSQHNSSTSKQHANIIKYQSNGSKISNTACHLGKENLSPCRSPVMREAGSCSDYKLILQSLREDTTSPFGGWEILVEFFQLFHGASIDAKKVFWYVLIAGFCWADSSDHLGLGWHAMHWDFRYQMQPETCVRTETYGIRTMDTSNILYWMSYIPSSSLCDWRKLVCNTCFCLFRLLPTSFLRDALKIYPSKHWAQKYFEDANRLCIAWHSNAMAAMFKFRCMPSQRVSALRPQMFLCRPRQQGWVMFAVGGTTKYETGGTPVAKEILRRKTAKNSRRGRESRKGNTHGHRVQ